jgi:hypothetical protein
MGTAKHKFTVILLRPDYMSENYGEDIYVALVEVDDTDCMLALTAAKKEVFKADKRDGLEPNDLDDYALCVMFSGHVQPCLFGWQL